MSDSFEDFFNEQMKGSEGNELGHHLWEGFAKAMGFEDSEHMRAHRQNSESMELRKRYEGQPGKHGFDTADEPYYEIRHPSGWKGRMNVGPYMEVGHVATGEDMHDAIDVGVSDERGHFLHPAMATDNPAHNHQQARKALDEWVHGYGHDYGDSIPEIKRWQRHRGLASRQAARDQETCPHDGGFNLHGQCRQCGYAPPTEDDEPCDHEWCKGFPEGWHTKGEHIDPADRDPHSDASRDAEKAIRDAMGDEHGWLLDQQHQGPSRYSRKQAAQNDPHDYSQCTSRKDDPTFCLWHKSDHLTREGEPNMDLDGHAKPADYSVNVPRCDLCDGMHDTLRHYDSETQRPHGDEGDALRGLPMEGRRNASLMEVKEMPNTRIALTAKATGQRIIVVAHDSGDGETIYHCPFCGSGQVIARSDRTIECEFCHTQFTVQVQPQYPAFPQTIDGMPVQVPGMPGQIGADSMGVDPSMTGAPPGADPMAGAVDPSQVGQDGEVAEDGGEPEGESEEGDDAPPWAKKSYRTASGAVLDGRSYLRHLAVRHADNRDAVVTKIKEERRG